MAFSGIQSTPAELLLRERVYDYLKKSLAEGRLSPGSYLNLSALEADLGLSRTPLRDALLRLEAEGFVTIHSRRGVIVNALDPTAIRDIYQIVGALESAAAEESRESAGDQTWATMERLNREMKDALSKDDFNEYYSRNLSFHDAFISLSANKELKTTIHTLKERLYDFPRQKSYLREWEIASVREHDEIIRLFRSGDYSGAAAYLRNTHWSYALQEHYVRAYYFKDVIRPDAMRPDTETP
ncbi:MAG TPA: GntR family transcriptional regulator [Spirochaetia bacterium]|nr:GntR family transcriptional regulator [Spirochaetales bacterium]HRY81130.1 GntR family transcriptional regulator [Spirochaetia bacterium]